jgi:uncharacterized membrane protein YphA (DoxX/SURF4 family)
MSTAPALDPRPRPWSTGRLIHHGGRILLGAFLIQMGLVKALDPADFLKLLREYHLLASPWPLNAIAALLPWFEIFCGLLLVVGIVVRGAALIVTTLFLAFSLAILHRALELQATLDLPFCAIRFDCGCGAGEILVCAKLLENLTWFALASWLVISRHAPRHLLVWR